VQEGLHKVVSDDETIVAISTPLGHSGIGVVRISGKECVNVAGRFFRPSLPISEITHRMVLVGAWNDAAGIQVDEVVVTLFKGPHSYTGEDVLEISAHGNPLVLRRIVECARLMGVRLATPGEFTLRAVANGKMDLTQAEAVQEFIGAQTEQQAKTALRQMDGALSKRIRPIKDKLVSVIAHLEAGIDFVDDDIDIPVNATVVGEIQPLRLQLEQLKDTFGYGKILSKGLRLAIVGRPNVGKSSLFNCLVSADRAIVTGTTRDVLTETVSIDGIPLCFIDTAGIRETIDQVESIGVMRTLETLSEVDLALVVLDGSSTLNDEDFLVLDKASRGQYLLVVNKSDLVQVIDTKPLNGAQKILISARTGQGLADLQSALSSFLESRRSSSDDDLILTNIRQCEVVTRASSALIAGERGLVDRVPHEMVLLDLYRALADLNELTGETVTDDILDRIFSTFCVGK
jgi:tRNA modification GTPase